MKNNTNELNGSAGSLLPAERHLKIKEILQERVTIRVSELSQLLNVSEMTIRRDLETLERHGTLERTHGGAVYRQERMTYESYNYENKLKESAEIKNLIGRKAAALVEPHDTLFLHSGTTACQLLYHLDPELPVRIYTNNVGAIEQAKGKRAEIILLGGIYNAESNSMEGPLTMEMIRNLHPKKAFLTVDGISLKDGITHNSFEEASLERAMIEQTRGHVVVMAQHTSFGRVADMVVAPVDKIDMLVVDHNLPSEYLRDLKAIGVRTFVA